MRKQAERRKQQILDKIALLRNKSNLKIPCSKQKIDFQCYDDINKDKRTNFCNLNFKKIDEQISCQEEENFCFMCCEALLNDYEEEIEKCEKTCNQKELKKENGKLQKHKEFKNESCNPNKNGSKDIKVLKK